MGWSIGFDSKWQRDIGYGVPAFCDCGCGAEIDRGLSYVCGGHPYGGEYGCGLYFDQDELFNWEDPEDPDEHAPLCAYCAGERKEPFLPSPDHPEWIEHKMTDPSWEAWRKENNAKKT